MTPAMITVGGFSLRLIVTLFNRLSRFGWLTRITRQGDALLAVCMPNVNGSATKFSHKASGATAAIRR